MFRILNPYNDWAYERRHRTLGTIADHLKGLTFFDGTEYANN